MAEPEPRQTPVPPGETQETTGISPGKREVILVATQKELSDLKAEAEFKRIKDELVEAKQEFTQDTTLTAYLNNTLRKMVNFSRRKREDVGDQAYEATAGGTQATIAHLENLDTSWWTSDVTKIITDNPTTEGLKTALAKFEELLRGRGDKNMITLWDASKATLEGLTQESAGEKEAREKIATILSKDEINDAALAGLKAKGEALKEKIAKATQDTGITAIQPELTDFEQAAELGITLLAKLNASESNIDMKTAFIGQDKIKTEITGLRKEMATLNTLDGFKAFEPKVVMLETKNTLWEKFNTLCSDPDAGVKKDQVKDALLAKPEITKDDLEKANEELQAVIMEARVTAQLSTAPEEKGPIDKLLPWFDKMEPKTRKMICGILVTIASFLSAIPIFGKSLAKGLCSRQTMHRMASIAGKTKETMHYAMEITAVNQIRGYGVPEDTVEEILDMKAGEFARINLGDLSTLTDIEDGPEKNKAGRATEKFRAALKTFSASQSSTAISSMTLAQVVGSDAWKTMMGTRAKPAETAPQTPEKTPEQKTKELLETTIGFTADQTNAVSALTVRTVLDGTATFPETTPGDKKTKLKGTLEKYIPEDEREGFNVQTTVAQFFTNRYQQKQPVEVV